MDWTIIGINFLYAALGTVLMWVAYRAFDRLTPQALAVRLGARASNVFTDSAAFTASVLTAAPQRPLVAPLLVIAAAVLLAETLITSGLRRRSA